MVSNLLKVSYLSFLFHPRNLSLGNASIQQITDKLRTMTVTQDLESLIDRQIDEVDILNILEGHMNQLLVHTQIDTNEINKLFDRNIENRSNRINERLQLIHILKTHIENERLKRMKSIFFSKDYF